MSALLATSAVTDLPWPPGALEVAIDGADWRAVEDDLGHDGFAVLPSLWMPAQCETIAGYFFDEQRC